MGRYITGTAGASGGAGMRSERHVITASNPALAVPAWAKVARVSGVGGGGGGSVDFGTTGGVASGGCGGIAANALMPLNGAAFIAVTIGAGGAGKAAGSSGAGGVGGNTTITAGNLVMTLEGASGVMRGRAFMGTVPPQAGYSDSQSAAGLIPGYYSAAPGDGASSPFGGGGAADTDAVGDGGDATGYGAGGGGSHGGRGGHGSPGIVILEFLEAV